MLTTTCFRLLVLLLLIASMTEAVTSLKEYPPAALDQDACFTSICKLSAALYDGGTATSGVVSAGYLASFSSQDGRWNYSPRNIFDKVTAGYPGQWHEGSYSNADYSFKYDLATPAPHTRTLASSNTEVYPGEWVRLDLPGTQTFTKMKLWTSTSTDGAKGRPLNYKVYGSTNSGSTWTGLLEVTDEATIGNDGILAIDLQTPGSYSTYILVVNKLAGTSITLKIYELLFYTADTYCPSNKKADDAVMTDCILCDQGTYSLSLNALLCLGKCPAGTYMPSQTAPTTCTTCTTGTWSAAGAFECTPCAAGKFSTTISGTGIEVCSPCRMGTWTYTLPNGVYTAATGATACTACPAGKAGGSSGCTTTCTAATPSAVGATACNAACPAGTVKGTTTGVDDHQCLPCSAGTKRAAADASCLNCDTGTFSGAAASACVSCPLGSYSASQASCCTKCIAGQFGSTANTCTNCAAGKSSLPGATMCINCEPGKYASVEGSPTCANCPAGSYNTAIAQTTCTNCDAGKFSSVGATVCTTCPAGYTTSASGVSYCDVCLM